MMKYEVYDKPGKYLSLNELEILHHELLSVAKECLDEIPYYQCLTGLRSEYERLIIAVARGKNGKILGFCSSYILDGKEMGNILHLGLTCVLPLARRMGLTHKLTGKVVMTYLVRYSLFKKAWISNVACVLSSLGNVAMHFEDVYPSPFTLKPSGDQIKIARLINEAYRWELYINKEARFDEKKFVFERSVIGTMFEKSESDKKYYHRDPGLTQFYLNRINFDNGDEVLQIGKVGLFTFPKYLIKTLKKKFVKVKVLRPSQNIA